MDMEFSRGSQVACKACSGCIFFIFGVTLAVLLAGSSLPSAPAVDTLAGFTYSSALAGRDNVTAGTPPDIPVDVGTAGLYGGYDPSVVSTFNVLWLVMAALFWDFVWLTLVPIAAYWGLGGDPNQSIYFAAIERDHNWFRWIQWGASHALYFLAVYIVAGAWSVIEYVYVPFTVASWMFALSVNEAYHAKREFEDGSRRAPAKVYESFLWAAVLFLVVAATTFVYVYEQTADPNFVLSTLLYSLSWSVFVIYFLVLLVVGVAGHTFFGLFSVSGKELFYELSDFIVKSIITWIIAGFALGRSTAP